MPTAAKRLLFGFLLLLLLVPALQAKFHWLDEVPLGGAYTVAPRPEFSWASLVDNTFQPALERYLEDRIGFRGFFVRLRNQLGYSVFHESWAGNFAVGRGGVLFEQEPIDAYLGRDYVGDEEVRFNARRFRSAQDSLARHGVQVVFVIAPSKATFMPENLPRAARAQPRARTNYAAYAAALPAAGVHVLDFSRAFRQWRRTAPYPLFTKGGTHWSMYGGVRAADSLLAYLRHTLGVRPAPLRITGYEQSTTPRETDADLVTALNLLVAPASEPLAYPQLEFPPLGPGQAKPNLLLVADSFGWTWMYTHIPNCFSDQTRYWYYNAEVAWPDVEQTPEGRDLAQLKTRAQYLARDVIVVMFNERNLVTFDKGFSRDVFNVFHPTTAADNARFNALVDEFRRKATWEEQAQEGFEQRIGAKASAILDRERCP
ncbi:hypothetical protein ACFQ48_06820 [Hymenobacter caeli]|uniref:AlgX/AlgJ SGNH hydrolase-like domain-containing protein n=1 Tax=Hymenobacter caeli TaxID=2735894 RepID=A0ABX2FP24_9BACT|nr:hypothetical protein [Hymenobacter caeli]NRT18895.1 hypothetical protein [Hymenobacter caeli]